MTGEVVKHPPDDDPRRLNPEHVQKLRSILALLDAAEVPSDMDLPGLRLHPLIGDRAGTWAVTVERTGE